MPARLIVNRDSAPRSLNVGGEKFVTTPDVTATGSYIGEKQTRYYKVDGDNLTIKSGVQQGSLYPGKKTVSTNVFVREK